MNRCAFFFAGLCLALSWARGAEDAATALFDPQRIAQLEVRLPAAAFDNLKTRPRDYVRATITVGTQTWHGVAVRLKGRTGSFRAIDDKPSLTLDFDRFVPGQKFRGRARIHLNNSVEDPSFLHEWIGSKLFNDANIPAPQVAHALVKLNGRRLGMYVLKEGFTREFLVQHFPLADGNLYEPEPGPGADVAGPMRRNSGSGSTDRSELRRLADVAALPDLKERWRTLGSVLDTNRFLSFLAMEILIGHRDGYALARNNYRLYHDPASQRFVFLPSGMDNLLGRVKTSLQPRMTGTIAVALLGTPEGHAAYRVRMKTIFVEKFQVESLTRAARERAAAIARELPRAERKDLMRETEDLIERIELRAKVVTEQINAWSREPSDARLK